ncbi:MAG: protein translocase subunit SecD [Gammaproteobacteria bacterium]|nr:MAG: protein translocase subunit SecD [Gammaproteobacteria bacterium]TLZ06481.1 MAG: protein translocase subunit SecD [Gammaproteobacteria bacterium]TLZ07886.1 MAG: protein translocase subunit SecD [Gammaproteobacteria bacterium]TLZ11299.1 MAG: protein translocase subunit SecD [Gammaproteobacteria bacterium]TLZ20316.1 MAG: protein translocase subunit SecD [Gammaproteobacteria bacterium]
MLEYARWKYILVAVVLLLALLFALPNVFGEDPALQVERKDHSPVTQDAARAVESFLGERRVHFARSYIDGGRLMVRFGGVADQLAARDAVNERFADTYRTALSFAPRTPELLRAVGLRPMPLGLDLRGGLYLLYQVDVNAAVAQAIEGYAQDARRALAAANIPVKDASAVAVGSDKANAVRVVLPPEADVNAARTALNQPLTGLAITTESLPSGSAMTAVMTPAQIREREDYAIQQNITTLRNRVNELGVSEPIVQRQGIDRINVQLPGVQNSAEVKDILGRVATLEFRLEDMQNNAFEAMQTGRVPLGSKLYTHTRLGRPILLRREVIATGDQLTNATTGQSQEGPAVNVRLDARAGESMLKTTRANVNKRMAVVLIEKRRETSDVNGRKVTRDVTDEEVINDATIRGIFSNNFQITGLAAGEARELALLLRSGSLAIPLYPIEERAVGPSLGRDNIDKGVTALIVGMAGVFVFMAIYYKTFGLVADAVLLSNVVLLTALLSMMRASLSLPGIAGIILTVGMAVDANVLIYERIREELRKGVTPQAAIRAGFEKAFSAIADSNITTLIAGVVLWVFGTGPIRGFAVVLTLGIATSMFTSLMGSRALLTLMYGGRRKLARLSI